MTPVLVSEQWVADRLLLPIMDVSGPTSLNAFFRSYDFERFTWESDQSCCQSSAFWSTFGYGSNGAKGDYEPVTGLLSESESLSSADMSISTDSSSKFMSCLSGHDADSCTSLSSASSSAKIPLSVVAWLGIHDTRVLTATPEAVKSPEKLNADACFLIYAWTSSFFADVAQQALEPDPAVALPSIPSPQHVNNGVWNPLELLVTTKSPLFDRYETCSPTVNLNLRGATSLQRSPLARHVDMPGSVDYEMINPEQIITARNVCMWGRRLERIPKVRVPGQEEAIYCFDEHKLRQSQVAKRMQVTRQQRCEPSINPTCNARNHWTRALAKGTQSKRQAPADAASKFCLSQNNLLDTRPPLSPRRNAYGGGNVPQVPKTARPVTISQAKKSTITR